MLKIELPESQHFTLQQLSEGVYACIHKLGGAAYSNAGIIDLGNKTIVLDAFDTMVAGRDLRHTAEVLFGREVHSLLLTHPHSDHWIGATVFDKTTVMWTSKTSLKITKKWGRGIVKDFQDRGEWEAWIKEMEGQLKAEQDERVRISLENSIIRTRYVMAEMAEFQPRYADQTFDEEEAVIFQGSERTIEFRSLGRGHSEDDAVLLLPEDEIAFIGDIGFFDTQPFLGFCDLDLYRKHLHYFQNSDYKVFVPGHGPVGNAKKDIVLQLRYLDVLENMVGEIIQRGGSFEEAKQIILPEPFDTWLMGGMGRFETNVRYLFEYLGGAINEKQ